MCGGGSLRAIRVKRAGDGIAVSGGHGWTGREDVVAGAVVGDVVHGGRAGGRMGESARGRRSVRGSEWGVAGPPVSRRSKWSRGCVLTECDGDDEDALYDSVQR